MNLKLLVSPLAKGAYFDAYLDVARAEFSAYFPGVDVDVEQIGGLDFLVTDLEEALLPSVARLSFVQGAFGVDDEAGLTPLPVEANFLLPEALVYGAKYRGKTNELVTQLAINLALRFRTAAPPAKTLLDPMAGKGTTLLWGLRYGLNGKGIEQDPGAPQELHRHVKKQAKLHRIKHTHTSGFVGKKKKTKDGAGAFVHYEMAEHSLRLFTGDSRTAPTLLGEQRFDVIVSDLPYGVQFKSGPKRSPLEVVRECADGWVASLRDGGAMVLVFNTYQPSRQELAALFTERGCHLEDFSAPHRMSESIVRDLLVLTRTPAPQD